MPSRKIKSALVTPIVMDSYVIKHISFIYKKIKVTTHLVMFSRVSHALHVNHSIQVYLYSAFYESIVAKQLYRKLSFYLPDHESTE